MGWVFVMLDVAAAMPRRDFAPCTISPTPKLSPLLPSALNISTSASSFVRSATTSEASRNGRVIREC
jgi:hypothetical protein